jgi:hypothetical protein
MTMPQQAGVNPHFDRTEIAHESNGVGAPPLVRHLPASILLGLQGEVNAGKTQALKR